MSPLSVPFLYISSSFFFISVFSLYTQGIQNIGIEDFQWNRIVEQSQVLKIWENYITELHDQPNRPVTLKVEREEEVDADKKGLYILQS